VNFCPFVIRERTMADTTRDELGVPNVVDRATFQAELDAFCRLHLTAETRRTYQEFGSKPGRDFRI
jgi:hypothetical protein